MIELARQLGIHPKNKNGSCLVAPVTSAANAKALICFTVTSE